MKDYNGMIMRINNKMPVIHDFLSVILSFYNDSKVITKDIIACIEEDKRVNESKRYICKDLPKETPGLCLFFSNYGKREHYSFIKHTYSIMKYDFNTIDDFYNHFFNINKNKFKINLLKFYDLEGKEDEFYSVLIRNPHNLYSYINEFEVCEQIKLELLGFIYDPKRYLNGLRKFFDEVRKRVLKVYEEYQSVLKSFEQSLRDEITSGHFFNTEFKNSDIDFGKYKDIQVSYSFLDEHLIHTAEGNHRLYMILGINYKKVVEVLFDNEFNIERESFLKAIADKYRMQIIWLLQERNMYVGDMVPRIKIPLSKIVYHLDILSSAGIVNSRPENNRTYYELNKELSVKKLQFIIAQLFYQM